MNIDFIGFSSKIKRDEGELELSIQTYKMILSEEELLKIKQIMEETINKVNLVINN